MATTDRIADPRGTAAVETDWDTALDRIVERSKALLDELLIADLRRVHRVA
ncbi:MAG: hypothetical protein NVS4B6_10580 [Mycobacterium sp.]